MSTKVIIIGASSGIGEALSKEFARHGCIVGMTARRTELLEGIKKRDWDTVLHKIHGSFKARGINEGIQ
ncbi:MAG: SDR family NAD(P)-dependent oxidoreductase [Pseudomonadota bacterium]